MTVLIGIAVGSKAVAGVIHQPYYNYKTEGATVGRTFYGLVGEDCNLVTQGSSLILTICVQAAVFTASRGCCLLLIREL